jgi:transposase
MKRFVQGQSRTQTTLLPDCLDDYVSEDNPVRVIDAFVDQLACERAAWRSKAG